MLNGWLLIHGPCSLAKFALGVLKKLIPRQCMMTWYPHMKWDEK
jgi:hypothetical protein